MQTLTQYTIKEAKLSDGTSKYIPQMEITEVDAEKISKQIRFLSWQNKDKNNVISSLRILNKEQPDSSVVHDFGVDSEDEAKKMIDLHKKNYPMIVSLREVYSETIRVNKK